MGTGFLLPGEPELLLWSLITIPFCTRATRPLPPHCLLEICMGHACLCSHTLLHCVGNVYLTLGTHLTAPDSSLAHLPIGSVPSTVLKSASGLCLLYVSGIPSNLTIGSELFMNSLGNQRQVEEGPDMRNALKHVGSRLTSAFPQQAPLAAPPSAAVQANNTHAPPDTHSWSLLASIFNDGFHPSSPLLPHVM